MNQREKEEYLREYAVLKAQGKPFFPYVVAKDGWMMIIVVGVIMLLSWSLGAELLAKADATTTTYAPRPEWYYFWAFELLRVVKPPELVGLATVGIPTIAMILLFLLPFYDRSPERDPRKRPLATMAGIFVAGSMFYLSFLGAEAEPPSQVRIKPPESVKAGGKKAVAEWNTGRLLVAQSGCGGCHKIGPNGNDGPGPQMTNIGDRLKADAIRQTLINPTAPMPSFKDMGPENLKKMADFLATLKRSDVGAHGEGSGGH